MEFSLNTLLAKSRTQKNAGTIEETANVLLLYTQRMEELNSWTMYTSMLRERQSLQTKLGNLLEKCTAQAISAFISLKAG